MSREEQTSQVDFWVLESVKDRAIEDDFDLAEKPLYERYIPKRRLFDLKVFMST